MRSRTRIAVVIALIGLVGLIQPGDAAPLPRERHAQLQHKPPSKARETARVARAQRAHVLSARASYTVPALVAEARKYVGTNPTDRKRLWCATFMNFVLAKLGYAGTNSDAARSFAYYGRRIAEPRVGAIAVLTRGRHGGHVGVVSGIDKNGDPIIISGNHNRLVGEGVYPRSRVIAYVMPTEPRPGTRLAASAPVSLPAADATLDSPIGELIAAIEAEQKDKLRTHRVARPAPRAAPHRQRQAQRPHANPISELIGAIKGGKRRDL